MNQLIHLDYESQYEKKADDHSVKFLVNRHGRKVDSFENFPLFGIGNRSVITTSIRIHFDFQIQAYAEIYH